jgi:hypothetical protein
MGRKGSMVTKTPIWTPVYVKKLAGVTTIMKTAVIEQYPGPYVYVVSI